MRIDRVRANGLEFDVRVAGPEDGPLLLMLHGFPEYSGAWNELIGRLSDRFLCVAPDQRGYAGSDKPFAVADYQTGKLVADALGVLDRYREGGRAAAVIGHDWGASVAYALAFRAPERVERLIVANGVHPIPFQRALAAGGAQSEASRYIDWLRAEGSEDKLAADNFAGMMRLFSARMDTSWMTPQVHAGHHRAWSVPGAVRGMVNWYRATPLKVARPGRPIPETELPPMPAEAMRVTMPHLLLWGMRDEALLAESREGLEAFCDALTVREFPDADHWIIHQRPDEVESAIRAFLAPEAPSAH